MTDMTVSETLNKAADHIQQFGWVQGMYRRRVDGSPTEVCAMGAIYSVVVDGRSEGRFADCPFGESVGMVLTEHLGSAVATWNDKPERTAEEVIATLRAAAVIADSREPATEAATR